MTQLGRPATLQLAASFLSLAAFWLVTRPEIGLVDDAQLYAVQILHAANPAPFAGDLYFQFGSQDQFTLFSRLCLPLYRALGLARMELLLLVAGQAAFLTGLFCLARQFFSSRSMIVAAMAGAIILPGNLGFLEPGEAVVTPRIFAEAVCLFAMAAMLSGRPMRAVALLAVGLVIHPLMTLPAAAIFFVWHGGRRPLWWAVVLMAALLAVAMAFAKIPPFDRLLLRFDPAWFASVGVQNQDCFIIKWSVGLYLPVIGTFALCTLARFGPAMAWRFARTVMIVMSAALLTMFVGGDWLKNVFVVDVQPWRGVWLLAIAAHLAAGPVLVAAVTRARVTLLATASLLALALIMVILSGFILGLCLFSTPAIIAACLAFFWERADKSGQFAPARRVFIGVCLGLSCSSLLFSFRLWAAEMTFNQGLVATTLLAWYIIAAGLAILVQRRMGWLLVAGAAGLVLLAAAHWDRRFPSARYVETSAAPPADLAAMLPPSGPIYWDDNVEATWFLLHRANYASCEQGLGVLFSRGTALAYSDRTARLAGLNPLDTGLNVLCPDPAAPGGLRTGPAPPAPAASLHQVCMGAPELAAVILAKPAIGAVPTHVWKPPVPFPYESRRDRKAIFDMATQFYIYDCNDLRS